MGMLSVSSCCCFDLHTGGLIIGYIELFLSAIIVGSSFSDPIIIFWNILICGLICGCWVYGVHSRRHGFMVPNIVISAITYVICMSLLIIIPILAFGTNYEIHQYLGPFAGGVTEYSTQFFLYIFIACAIVTTIIWSITAVKYSLYQHIKIATYGRNADLYGHSECINIAVKP